MSRIAPLAPVALNVFTNYFNTLADTDVDFPAVRASRNPAATRHPIAAST